MEPLNNQNSKIKRGYSQNQKIENPISNNLNDLNYSKISQLRIENRKLKSEILAQKNMANNYSRKIFYLNKTISQLKNQLSILEKNNKESLNEYNNYKFNNYDDEKDSAIRAVEDQIINEICNNQDIDLVERLPIVTFKSNYLKESNCGICRDDFKDGENVKVLKCQHLFHRECLGQWLINNKKCPICDKVIKL